MNVSVFSFLMAILWCNVFIIVITLMRRRFSFIANFSIMPLLFLIVVSILRLFFFFEFPTTTVIRSTHIYPAIIDFFTTPIALSENIGLPFSILDICFIVWIAGTVYVIQRYLCQWMRLTRSLRIMKGTTDSQILASMDTILSESGKHVEVKIVQAQWITIPMVMGLFKPTIYLPAIPFTDSELYYILSHEWTHFLHKDAWIKMFVFLVSAVFWWNPFIHILKSNLDDILEIRCDLKLTARMDEEEQIQYLESIMKVLRYKVSKQDNQDFLGLSTSSGLITKNAKKIEQRFRLITHSSSKKKYRTLVLSVYVLILTAFCLSNLFIIQPIYPPTVDKCYEETFTINSETTYLEANENGTYSLYVNGEYQGDLNTTEVSDDPLSSLPIHY